MAGAFDDAGRRTATVTVLFSDLVGSTERLSRLGDEAADEFRREFFATLDRVVTQSRGEVVKNTGDGLMVVYRTSAVDAITAASRMHDQVEALDRDDRTYLRVGVSAGEAACEDDDWFGTPVIEAARLCAAAEPGQTLVTEVVRALAGTRGGHQFRSVGTLTLKGLSEPVATAAVIRTPVAAPIQPADRRSRLWPVALVAAVLVVAIVAAALLVTRNDSQPSRAAPVARGYTPRFEPSSCAPEVASAAAGVVCGTLLVPENRSKPAGRSLRLPVARVPAHANGDRASDPTLAVGYFGLVESPVKSPALEHSDVIMFATRVSQGENAAMSCPEFDSVSSALLAGSLRDPATIASGKAALRACYDRLTRSGVDLTHYSFVDAAEDIVDLIRALRLDQVNLVAAADEVPIAFHVAHVAPAAVRTLTLENPVTPGASGLADPVAALARALDRLQALCDADAKCGNAYPNLLAKIRDNDRTFDANPQTMNVDFLGRKLRVRVDADHSVRAVAFAMGDRSAVGLLPAGITTPPTDITALLAARFDFRWSLPNFPIALHLSRVCGFYDKVLSGGRALSRETLPELAGFDDGSLEWTCSAWPVPGPAEISLPYATTVPTLIVEGDLTWWTSPQAVADLQSGLPNSKLLLFPTLGAGRGPMGLLADGVPVCLNELRRAFLAQPEQNLDVERCARQSPGIDFLTAVH